MRGVRQLLAPITLLVATALVLGGGDVLAKEDADPESYRTYDVGGGLVTDVAKYIGWKNNLPTVTVPTVLSQDGFFTGFAGFFGFPDFPEFPAFVTFTPFSERFSPRSSPLLSITKATITNRYNALSTPLH